MPSEKFVGPFEKPESAVRRHRSNAILFAVVQVAVFMFPQAVHSQKIPKEALADIEFAVKPRYPPNLERNGVTGSGVYWIEFDHASGRVREVVVVQSAGDATLDGNAMRALKRWRAKPHTLQTLRVPIEFGKTIHVPATPDSPGITFATSGNVLAMFYIKWKPMYPYEARRAGIHGSGVYRMYVDPDGTVTKVGVIKSTGNKLLDINAANGLIHWRAKPGSKREVDLPVTFSLGGHL